MILLMIALFAILVGFSLFGNDSQYNIPDEYCNLECRERSVKRYMFCC